MDDAPKCGMCKKPLDVGGNCANCDDRQKEKRLLIEPPEFKSRDENTCDYDFGP